MSMQRSLRKHRRSPRTFPRCEIALRPQSARLNRASASRRQPTKNSARSAAAKVSPRWRLRPWNKDRAFVVSSEVETSLIINQKNSKRFLDSARNDRIKMALRFFNTYSRELEEFHPLDPNGRKID